MAPIISFLKIIFLNTPILLYQNCNTNLEEDCRYQEFDIEGSTTSTVLRCGSESNNLYMGPYGFKSTVSKTFENVSQNTKVELKLTIAKLDSWDLETLQIWGNDELLESLTFSVFEGTKMCRLDWFEELIVQVTKTFQTTKNGLTIKLQDNLDQDLLDESWGFRDVTITLISQCITNKIKFQSYFLICFESFFFIFMNYVINFDKAFIHNFCRNVKGKPKKMIECNYEGEIFTICQGGQVNLQRNIPFEIKSISLGPNMIVKLKGPDYYGGVLKDLTASEPCLDIYKFPKQVQPT